MGGIRSIISKGEISKKTAFELMPFENQILLLKVAPGPRPVAFVSWHFTDYVSMALCMGDNRVGDTSGQLAMPPEMGLARRGFSSGTSSPS